MQVFVVIVAALPVFNWKPIDLLPSSFLILGSYRSGRAMSCVFVRSSSILRAVAARLDRAP